MRVLEDGGVEQPDEPCPLLRLVERVKDSKAACLVKNSTELRRLVPFTEARAEVVLLDERVYGDLTGDDVQGTRAGLSRIELMME